MTPSEIAFLGIGLVLGAGVGAALAQVLRGRPSTRREVRLTITPNAIPAARTRTLAVPHATPHPGLIPGSPDAGVPPDPAAGSAGPAANPLPASPAGAAGGPNRTRVPSSPVTLPSSAVAIPVERTGPPPAPPVGVRPPPGGSGMQPAQPIPWPGVPATPRPAPTTPGEPAGPGAGPGASPPGPSHGPTALAEPRPTGRHPTIAPVAVTTVLAAVRSGEAAPAAEAGPSGIAAVTGMAVSSGVAVAEPPADAPAARDEPEGFTTLVRPRSPVDDVRPTLAAAAIAVAERASTPASGHAAVVTPAVHPPVRLAAPSEPTLSRPASPRPFPVRSVAVGRRANGAAAQHGDGGQDAAGGMPAAGAGAAQPGDDPCAGSRWLVEERCALAGVAREQARAATDALQEARRRYDILREQVDHATSISDPRRVAAEKDRLHAAFRTATERGGSPEETEAAARAWLDEINALNAAVREAARQVEHGSAELRATLPGLERLSAEADAARIAGENAEAGCQEARQALAECEEAEARREPAPPPEEEPDPFAHAWPQDQPNLPAPAEEPAGIDRLGAVPVVSRVLRGDRDARERLVATLAAGDAEDRREWQLRLSRLVDAVVGRAIEDGYLDLPQDDPFWRLFEPREARDIVGALSALGFRYDGLGGFADGRVPAARDLSLAVGYAGLDRMRIRTWPPESGLATLYARAEVAADEWLADQAGDLSLGRMVDALGGRAAELADLWNAWGRVRPALLAT